MSTLTQPDTNADGTPMATRRSRWPLWGAAAGALGIVGTLVTDVRPDRGADVTPVVSDVPDLDRVMYHIGVVAGYLAVACLLVAAAAWRRYVEPRLADSIAARVVANGMIASAGALSLGYGWKGAMAVYLPGGMDEGAYDSDALFVFYLLNDFGAYIGWLGVTVAACAVAWMAFRERTVSRWIGVVSVLLVLPVVAFLVGTGLPGFPGVVGGIWMLVAMLGLAFGKSPATR